MSQNTVTKEALTSVINGLFQSIEAENEEKSQNLSDKYDDGKTDLNRQTYWSPSCFKDTDDVKEQFKKWWRVIEEN